MRSKKEDLIFASQPQMLAEIENDAGGFPKDISISDIWGTKEMSLALIAGVEMKICKQLVAITVMYYSPSIMELAGFAAHRTALLLLLVVAAVNALGTVPGILLTDRVGIRQLVLVSLIGVMEHYLYDQ